MSLKIYNTLTQKKREIPAPLLRHRGYIHHSRAVSSKLKGWSVIVVRSKNGTPIRLTQERWRHIVERHPEMENQKEKLLETLNAPDLVQQGDMDTFISAKFYAKTPLTKKFLVVIYREINRVNGFVLTAYFTNRPSERRKVLWKP